MSSLLSLSLGYIYIRTNNTYIYTHTNTHLLGAGSTVENEEDRLVLLALGLLLDVSLRLAKDLRRQLPEKQISRVIAIVNSVVGLRGS